MALEFKLRAPTSQSHHQLLPPKVVEADVVWEEVIPEEGPESRYYWNRNTNETTYETPQYFIPASDPSESTSAVDEKSNPTKSPWVYVPQNGEDPAYYWNQSTNETSFDPPEGVFIVYIIC
jgi:hypothetical protein